MVKLLAQPLINLWPWTLCFSCLIYEMGQQWNLPDGIMVEIEWVIMGEVLESSLGQSKHH